MDFLILLRNCRKMYLLSDPHGNTRASPDPLNGNKHKSPTAAGTPALLTKPVEQPTELSVGRLFIFSSSPLMLEIPQPLHSALWPSIFAGHSHTCEALLGRDSGCCQSLDCSGLYGTFYALFCFPGVFYPNL